MKTHARVRRATSKTLGSVVKARVFFSTPRSVHFVIYVVDKGICEYFTVFYNGGQLLFPAFMFKHELAIWYRDALLYTACCRRGCEIRGACTTLFDTISAGADPESEGCIVGIFLCLQKRHFWASTHHTC